jgi:hypothetical protein
VGIVACNALLLGPGGFLPGMYQEGAGVPGEVTLTRLLGGTNPIYGSVLVPRRAVDEAGGFCPDISGSEDIDLWIRIVELGYRVVATSRPLAVYRLGPTSVSSDIERMSKAKTRTYERALERRNLNWRQRRVVHRWLRFHRALIENEQIAAARRDGGMPYGRVVRAIPLFVLVVLEHPSRWRALARKLRNASRPGARNVVSS